MNGISTCYLGSKLKSICENHLKYQKSLIHYAVLYIGKYLENKRVDSILKDCVLNETLHCMQLYICMTLLRGHKQHECVILY